MLGYGIRDLFVVLSAIVATEGEVSIVVFLSVTGKALGPFSSADISYYWLHRWHECLLLMLLYSYENSSLSRLIFGACLR